MLLTRVRDTVKYRDLLLNLVTRDLKVRYRSSFLGVLWSLLNPLLMMLVYVLVFTQLLRGQSPPLPPQLLVDNWSVGKHVDNGGRIALDGGQHYAIKIEFFDESYQASVRLLWQLPGGAVVPVPSAALYPSAVPTTTHGLTGEYFNNPDLSDLRLTRIDPQVSFNWGLDPPATQIERDTFSVRWTGQVATPPGLSGLYGFFVEADDGVRLWIDNGRPGPTTPPAEVQSWTINRYFPVFILTALLPWNWFAAALLGSMRSVVDNGHLIKKVFFPRELLPLSTVLSNLVNFLLALPVLFALIIWLKPTFSLAYLWLPVLVLMQTLFLCGLAFFFAALNTFFRDTFVIMEVGVTAWFFLTPVFYDIKQVWPDLTDWIYRLNPMASLISNYREVLFWGTPPDPFFVLRTLLTVLVIFAVGYIVFIRSSKVFGELL